VRLEGWGRYPRHDSEVETPEAVADVASVLRGRRGAIARGNGRAYGDAAMGAAVTVMTKRLNRMKSFDPASGLLTVEAGVLLGDILDTFVPRGFFPPVVPGTKLVSVGGMIAADVHGKNHHRDGGFGAHLKSIRLLIPSGEVLVCSPQEHADLFAATIGGMGLTGIILEASFTLRPIETAWIAQRTTVAANLDEALAALDAADQSTYSVAWIDCLASGAALGRSLVYAGEHASRAQVQSMHEKCPLLEASKAARLGIPIDLPAWTLNKASVGAFNELYFRRGAMAAGRDILVHYNPYFFPLDGVERWHRVYGKRGFVQHQSVIPPGNAHAVIGEIVERFARMGTASFLAVLKKLGTGSGLMSFPMQGYTLALDLKVTDEIFPMLEAVDAVVVKGGGRLYLAKDARQSRGTFEAGYGGLDAFRQLRRDLGADTQLASRLSQRLGI
jgi:FAD/FMN-containing dehydrogenase